MINCNVLTGWKIHSLNFPSCSVKKNYLNLPNAEMTNL